MPQPTPPQWNLLKRSGIEDSMVFHRTMDRYVGFLHWDLSTFATRIKLIAFLFSFLYLMASVVSIPMLDPAGIPIDFYFGMVFLFGAGGSCCTQWFVLAGERPHLRQVVQYLMELQLSDKHHPVRVRSRPWILIFTFLYWAQNVGQAVYWGFTLKHTSAIRHATHIEVIKMVDSWLYPPIVIMLGQMGDITQVTVFNVLLVFTVEFEILGQDIRRAIDRWDICELRNCIERHQRLLQMVMLLREKLRTFFMLTLEIYFFLITYACFVLVMELTGGGGSRSLFTIMNGAVAVMCLILFGWACDRLEVKALDIGFQVYDSAWTSKLVYRKDRANIYRSMKSNLLIVMMRTHNRIHFTCGSIFVMSLETSLKLLKLCYSTFTLMLSMIQRW